MKLAKSILILCGAMALTACLLPGALAQAAPAKTKTHHRAASKATATPAAAPVAQAAPEGGASPEAAVVKRDPFVPLVNEKKGAGLGDHLPPGKAGLVVATVRVDGTVKSPEGMLAVVSNPEQRVYFIREGDRLYDGTVEKIGLDGVTFRENSKDAFGRPVEREVTKRIYASAGEQQ
jgi:Tfp pilus assembly protein PilP